MSFEISAAAFESIIRSLRSDKQTGRGSDKRKNPRVGLSGRVTIIPCSPNSQRTPVIAMVRDLSTTGIGLAHGNALSDGEQVIVRFAATHDEPAKSILCTVTHSHTIGERLCTTGAKFIKDIEIAGPPVPAKPPARKK
jgi:c-di-GMP-binding flagellar brake protein YcgR